MSSNEHPDMSGNWSDVPYVCEKCGCRFTDDAKLSGSFFSTETILCSQECSVEYDYAIAEQLAADNARLRELLRRWVAEFPYAEVMLHDSELKRDSDKELGQ